MLSKPWIGKLFLVLVCFAFLLGWPGDPGRAQSPQPDSEYIKPFLAGPFPPAPAGGAEMPPVQNEIPAALEDVDGWSKLAYQSYRDGNWEIYAAAGDGSGAVNITNHPGSDARPALNRGATKIAFNSNRDGESAIYTINLNGSSLARLTSALVDDYAATWSPDATKIAFVSTRDGNPEIYVMNADGSGQTRLTNDPAADSEPAWSPDGSQIAWVRYSGAYGSILLMSPDGSNVSVFVSNLHYQGAVTWSPDGKYLAADHDYDNDNWNEIVMYDKNYPAYRKIYNPSKSFVDAWAGSWSPDGKWITFSEVVYGVSGDQLYIESASLEKIEASQYGSPFKQAIPGSNYDTGLSWQTADLLAPASQVSALPTYTYGPSFWLLWSGKDAGPAGITRYNMRYRLDNTEDWQYLSVGDYLTATTKEIDFIPFGSTVYFGSQASDEAGNVEAWGNQPDTHTTLVRWALTGGVSDNRGMPLGQTLVQLFPGPLNAPLSTDFSGAYRAWLSTGATYNVKTNQAGYGAIPNTDLMVNDEQDFRIYLPPQDNLLQNSDFENGLTGWNISSTVALTETTALAHTGIAALRLGVACSEPCLTDPDPVAPLSHYFNLAFDAQGNAHFIYRPDGNENRLAYRWRSSAGVWSEPSFLGIVPHTTNGLNPVLAVDDLGTVHVAFRGLNDSGQDTFYYSQKNTGGEWTTPVVVVGLAGSPMIATDHLGNVHVLYTGGQNINYLERTPSGTWNPPIILGPGFTRYNLVVGSDNVVHFIWEAASLNTSMGSLRDGINYQSRLPDGTFTAIKKLSTSGEKPILVIGPENQVYAFWNVHELDRDADMYAYHTQGGNWSSPMMLDQQYARTFVAMDSFGSLHSYGETVEMKGYYQSRGSSEGWSAPVNVHDTHHLDAKFFVGPDNLLHFLVEDWSSNDVSVAYQTSRLAEGDENMASSQRIHVLEGMHAPTLSFFYKITRTLPAGESRFEIQVNNGITTSVVFSDTTQNPWTQAWVDLQPWAGQTITLTFSQRQAAGEPLMQTYLDDVSLGSWLTPLVTDVSPNALQEIRQVQVITVTGENFLPTPTVRIGQVEITDVEMVDENTLRVTLPTSLMPGNQTLWVVNPGGQAGAWAGKLWLGRSVFLPSIHR